MEDQVDSPLNSNRRRFLELAFAGGAGVALSSFGTRTAYADQASILRIAMSSLKGEELDPIQGHPFKVLRFPLYDWLVGANEAGTDLSPHTGIATHWEQSADGTRWTFKLREGVPWHKGYGYVTAEDVAFTLNRLHGPDITTVNVRYFKNIKEARAVNKRTVVVDLHHRAVDFPIMVSEMYQTEGMVIPKAYYEKVGRDGFRRNPVGSGPYEFVSQNPGKDVRYRSAGKHWSLGTPRFVHLVVSDVHEDTTRTAMLEKRAADLIDAPRRSYGQLKKLSGITTKVKVGSSMFSVWFPEQTLPGSPFGNDKVRQALSLAIDRAQIVQLFGGKELARIATRTTACRSWSPYCPASKPDPYDPARARRLLKESGVGNFEIQIHTTSEFPEQADVSAALAGFWEAIGLAAQIIPMDFATWRSMSIHRKLPPTSAVAHEVPNSVLAAPLMLALYSKRSPFHLGFLPAAEPYIAQIVHAKTFEEQGRAEGKAEKLLFEHRLELPLIESGEVIAFDHKVVDKHLGGHQYVDFGLREILTGT